MPSVGQIIHTVGANVLLLVLDDVVHQTCTQVVIMGSVISI